MAKIALIQHSFPILNLPNSQRLSGLQKQLYDKFFEVLAEESGHQLACAESLEAYQAQAHDAPQIVICNPFPTEGNLAGGFAELTRLQAAFPALPMIIWTTRTEASIQKSCLEDYRASAFYNGTLLEAPDGLADLILEYL